MNRKGCLALSQDLPGEADGICENKDNTWSLAKNEPRNSRIWSMCANRYKITSGFTGVTAVRLTPQQRNGQDWVGDELWLFVRMCYPGIHRKGLRKTMETGVRIVGKGRYISGDAGFWFLFRLCSFTPYWHIISVAETSCTQSFRWSQTPNKSRLERLVEFF
jgi:hypothetical protein